MRALVCEAYGPIENLKIADLAVPEPKAGEILMRVGAAGGGLAPSGALAAAASATDGEVTARVTRLLRPPAGLGTGQLTLVGLAAVTAVPTTR